MVMKDKSALKSIECSKYLMENGLLSELLCHLWSLIDGKDFGKNVDKSLEWVNLDFKLVE